MSLPHNNPAFAWPGPTKSGAYSGDLFALEQFSEQYQWPSLCLDVWTEVRKEKFILHLPFNHLTIVFSKKGQHFTLEKNEKLPSICTGNALVSVGLCPVFWEFYGKFYQKNPKKQTQKRPVQLWIFFIKLLGTYEQKICIHEGLFLL